MKTTKNATVPAIEMTPEQIAAESLVKVERNIAIQTRVARSSIAKALKTQAESIAKAEASLAEETITGDISTSHAFVQSYWPLREGAEAAGKLRVYAMAAQKIGDFKREQSDPRRVLTFFRHWVILYSLGDSSRSESSSNQFSNAMSNADGQGRGSAYRDLFDMIECYLDGNDAE